MWNDFCGARRMGSARQPRCRRPTKHAGTRCGRSEAATFLSRVTPLPALVVLASIALAGCTRDPSIARAAPAPAPAQAASADQPMLIRGLAIEGYNYTDTGIGHFNVGYAGGGNIAVSSPTSGGGGTTCCVRAFLHGPPPPPKYRVEWSRDGDTWCTQDVEVTGPIPADPGYMEVHFYRDGHIELAVSEMPSPPRLKLEQAHDNSRHEDERLNVNNDAVYSRCRLGY